MRKYLIVLLGFVAGLFIGFGTCTSICEAAEYTPNEKLSMIRARHEILADVPMTAKPFNDPGVVLADPGSRFGVVAGRYYIREQRVFLLDIPTYLMEYTALHEAGHYFWYARLTQAQRNQYAAAWEIEQFSPSRYGREDIEENFAEMFAFVHGNRVWTFSGIEKDTHNSQQMRLISKFTEK